MEMSFLFALMSDQKQTIDICNISLSYHQPPSYEEKGQQKSSKWDGDPKITIPTNAPPPPLLNTITQSKPYCLSFIV